MGKFGIILAFLLSVAAAGGSYFLYQGWVEERTVRSSVEEKYDQVKEEINLVQSEKEQIKAEKEKVATENQGYRAEAEVMQAKLKKLKTQQSLSDSEKAALAEQLKSHQAMIAELQKKMGELEKKAQEAQAACGVTPADLKVDALSAPKTFTTTTTSVSTSAAPVVAGAGSGTSPLVFKPVAPGSSASAMPPVMSQAPVSAVKNEGPVVAEKPANVVPPVAPVPVAEVSPTPEAPVGAKVLTVNRKFNFVVINQGLQEGLKMGDRLKVLKQGKEVATVQVEKLYDKFSAATLVEEDPKQQVVEGDEIRKA